MRTPAISASLLTAVVLSPALISAAPMATHHIETYVPHGSAANSLTSRGFAGLGLSNDVFAREEPATRSISPREFWKKTVDSLLHHNKRISDADTLGGNAYSGSSGDVNGGSVYNPDTTMNEGMPTIINMHSNNAGGGGGSTVGCATAGKSSAAGVGGNAYSGSSGDARGGSVSGAPSGMMNFDSNNAGGAGETKSGCATGGDTHDTSKAP